MARIDGMTVSSDCIRPDILTNCGRLRLQKNKRVREREVRNLPPSTYFSSTVAPQWVFDTPP